MRQNSFGLIWIGILAALAALGAPFAVGSTVQFLIDESKSTLALSGEILGSPFEEQRPGSLVASISGKLMCHESDLGIQFMGDSQIVVKPNGVWRPGSNGTPFYVSGCYAGRASTIVGPFDFAVRNAVFDATSSTLPFGTGQFDAAGLRFSFASDSVASFDHNSDVMGETGTRLSGFATNEIVSGGSLRLLNGVQRLSVLVDIQFRFTTVIEGDSIARFKGQIIANQLDVPLISSIALDGPTVVMRAHGFGPSAILETSTDLKIWTRQSATPTEAESELTFALPANGSSRFYRVAP